MVIFGKSKFVKRQNQLVENLDSASSKLYAKGYADYARKLKEVSKNVSEDTFNLKKKQLAALETEFDAFNDKMTSDSYSGVIANINNMKRVSMKKPLEGKTDKEVIAEQLETYKAEMSSVSKEIEGKKREIQKAIDTKNYADWKLANAELTVLNKQYSDLELAYDTAINTNTAIKVAESSKARHAAISGMNQQIDNIDVVEVEYEAQADLDTANEANNKVNAILDSSFGIASAQESDRNEFDRLCEQSALKSNESESKIAGKGSNKVGE